MRRTLSLLAGVVLGTVAIVGCAKREAATNAGGSGPGTVVAESSGPGSAAALVTTTATVTAINQKTRMVTLHTADGENITFKADESIRNLPQVHKGDVVTTSYYESLAVSVREVKGGKPSITTTEEVQRAPLGSMPAGVVVRQTTLTAQVTAVDKKNQTVTLKGPKGKSVTVKVQDPANLEKAKVGHLVEVVYREAVGISVAKPTK